MDNGILTLQFYEAYTIEDNEVEVNLVESWTNAQRTFRAKHIWNRRSNLKGKEMKVFAVHQPPLYVIYPGEPEKNTGRNVEVVKELARRMNFTITYVIDDKSLVQGGVKHVMQELNKGHLDISSLFLLMKLDRMKLVEYSNVVGRSELLLATKDQLSVRRGASIFKIFHTSVWFSVALTIPALVLSGVVILVKINSSSDMALLEAAVTIYGACLSQGASRDVKSASFRLLLWSTLVFGMLFANALSANLISTLSTTQEEIAVKTLKDVSSKNLKMFISKGGNTEQDFKGAPEGSLKKELWKNNVDHTSDYFFGKDMINVFLDEEEDSAVLMEPIYLEMFIRENSPRGCNLLVTKAEYQSSLYLGR